MWPFKKKDKPTVEYRLYFKTTRGTVFSHPEKFYDIGTLMTMAQDYITVHQNIDSYKIEKKEL